jgi:hypothetical protein
VKKKAVLLYLFCICIVSIICQEFPYEPWGPWTTYPLYEDVAVIRIYKSERFYQNGHGGIWIRENYSYEGEEVPSFGTNGGRTIIKKYEPTDYGYLFYLIGWGMRHNPADGKPEFKDDMRMQVKMIFIGRDTCRFEFISLYDEEGYMFDFFVEENLIYHRYRVEDE